MLVSNFSEVAEVCDKNIPSFFKWLTARSSLFLQNDIHLWPLKLHFSHISNMICKIGDRQRPSVAVGGGRGGNNGRGWWTNWGGGSGGNGGTSGDWWTNRGGGNGGNGETSGNWWTN